MQDIARAAKRAKTKVTHFNAVSAGVEDILCLQVPVDNIVIMLEKEKTDKGLRLSFLHSGFLQGNERVSSPSQKTLCFKVLSLPALL